MPYRIHLSPVRNIYYPESVVICEQVSNHRTRLSGPSHPHPRNRLTRSWLMASFWGPDSLRHRTFREPCKVRNSCWCSCSEWDPRWSTFLTASGKGRLWVRGTGRMGSSKAKPLKQRILSVTRASNKEQNWLFTFRQQLAIYKSHPHTWMYLLKEHQLFINIV